MIWIIYINYNIFIKDYYSHLIMNVNIFICHILCVSICNLFYYKRFHNIIFPRWFLWNQFALDSMYMIDHKLYYIIITPYYRSYYCYFISTLNAFRKLVNGYIITILYYLSRFWMSMTYDVMNFRIPEAVRLYS